jgi:hypothetical protein
VDEFRQIVKHLRLACTEFIEVEILQKVREPSVGICYDTRS